MPAFLPVFSIAWVCAAGGALTGILSSPLVFGMLRLTFDPAVGGALLGLGLGLGIIQGLLLRYELHRLVQSLTRGPSSPPTRPLVIRAAGSRPRGVAGSPGSLPPPHPVVQTPSRIHWARKCSFTPSVLADATATANSIAAATGFPSSPPGAGWWTWCAELRQVRGAVTGTLGVSASMTAGGVIGTSASRMRHSSDSKVSVEAFGGPRMPSINLLGRLSHELNTSLNAILGAAQVLADTSADSELVNIVVHSSKVMANMVSDFLDLSQCLQHSLSLSVSTFPVARVLESVGKTFEKEAARVQVQMEFPTNHEAPPMLTCDRVRLRQVLVNLVCNSFNAVQGRRCPWIGVRTEAAMSEDGTPMLAFHVEDNGVGMTPAQQESLFMPFHQPPPSGYKTSAAPGCGLGLCLCYHLIALMGGTIRVESTSHVGTTVTFTLPLQPPRSPLIPHRRPPPPALPHQPRRRRPAADVPFSRRNGLPSPPSPPP
eukprot:RCo043441